MLARCGTFHHSMWLRLWQKHYFVLWHGERRGAWYGNIPACFSSNLFVHSFSECFSNMYHGPSIEAGTLRNAEEVEVAASVMLASPLLGLWILLTPGFRPLPLLLPGTLTALPAPELRSPPRNAHMTLRSMPCPALQTHVHCLLPIFTWMFGGHQTRPKGYSRIPPKTDSTQVLLSSVNANTIHVKHWRVTLMLFLWSHIFHRLALIASFLWLPNCPTMTQLHKAAKGFFFLKT